MSDLTEAERRALRSVPAEMALHSPEEFYAEIESVVRAIVKGRTGTAREAIIRQNDLPSLMHFERPSDFKKGVLSALTAFDAAVAGES